MRRMLVLFALLGTLLVVAVPASAITDGELDGNGHPYVGLMLAKSAAGEPLWRCSGTLMSERVFLTAGHCTEAPAAGIEIFFAPGPIQVDPNYVSVARGGSGCANTAVTGYPCHGDVGGTPYTHPQYDPNAFYRFDLGVVVLDRPHPMAAYGALPQQDVLDRLKTKRGTQDVTFTAVGYGLQKAFPDAASWKTQADRVRMVAHPRLIQINTGFTGDGSLLLSNNASTGGTCFGDSGGPNFVGASNVVAGVTSFGLNGTCGGTGGVYRVDRADDLGWLSTFGLAP
ncbi:trypsin-like serine protease [Gaiella occulta]|nr:trypsin-like serine protease [Gaiella occulta]